MTFASTAALLALALAGGRGSAAAPCALARQAPPAADVAADRAALLGGVETLERLGVPGSIAVFGERAFAVLTGGEEPLAVVAAARLGAGRIVAFGHGAYLEAAVLGEEGSGAGRLARNAVRWCAQDAEAPRVAALGTVPPPLAAALAREGIALGRIDDAPAPGELDVLVWADGRVGEPELAARIRAFVEGGGGLLVALCPWGWEQVNPARSLDDPQDSPHNAVLLAAGLCFARGYPEPGGAAGYAASDSRAELAHAGRSLALLAAGKQVPPAALAALEEAVRLLGGRAGPLRERLEAALAGAPFEPPSPEQPLRRDAVRRRLGVLVRSLDWQALAPAEVPAAPGAERFPGAVPKGAERVEAHLELDPAEPGWRGTGLYLAPGEPLTVRAQGARGWRLRIGCHADRLWGLAEWRRWPEITIERELPEGNSLWASPFGGPVYLVAGPDAGRLVVDVRGAVRAPRFVLDSAPSEPPRGHWLVPPDAPGPWAELEGRRLVLSVPSSALAAVAEPAAVLAWWDRVVDSHLALAGRTPPARRERFVADAQIVAGYMHAGYPIMTWLDKVTPPAEGGPPPLLDLPRLSEEGDWGYFHELGHNLQRSAWTFGGTGEVTCNLFSLWSMERVCGISAWEHPFLDGAKRALPGYLEAGAPFERWKREPALALLTYALVVREFGWEPVRRVLAEYEALPRREWPRTDPERIARWVRRLSLASGHDLRPYHRAFGWPLEGLLADDPALGALPGWMPQELESR